jgi:hypothetical protein
VKRSGRNEPMWIAIHTCMEATLGISLYSYLYLKLAKTLYFPYYLFFCFQQRRRTRGQSSFCPEVRGKGAQIMYTQVSKCKNYKIKIHMD